MVDDFPVVGVVRPRHVVWTARFLVVWSDFEIFNASAGVVFLYHLCGNLRKQGDAAASRTPQRYDQGDMEVQLQGVVPWDSPGRKESRKRPVENCPLPYGTISRYDCMLSPRRDEMRGRSKTQYSKATWDRNTK